MTSAVVDVSSQVRSYYIGICGSQFISHSHITLVLATSGMLHGEASITALLSLGAHQTILTKEI